MIEAKLSRRDIDSAHAEDQQYGQSPACPRLCECCKDSICRNGYHREDQKLLRRTQSRTGDQLRQSQKRCRVEQHKECRHQHEQRIAVKEGQKSAIPELSAENQRHQRRNQPVAEPEGEPERGKSDNPRRPLTPVQGDVAVAVHLSRFFPDDFPDALKNSSCLCQFPPEPFCKSRACGLRCSIPRFHRSARSRRARSRIVSRRGNLPLCLRTGSARSLFPRSRNLCRSLSPRRRSLRRLLLLDLVGTPLVGICSVDDVDCPADGTLKADSLRQCKPHRRDRNEQPCRHRRHQRQQPLLPKARHKAAARHDQTQEERHHGRIKVYDERCRERHHEQK